MIKALIKIKDFALFFILLFFAILLAVNKSFTMLTIEGVKTYFATLFPSLFPYLFISSLLSLTNGAGKIAKLLSPFFNKVFNVSGACGYAYLISIISGYPIGSIMVSEFKKQNLISEVEAERASALCSTSSPSFIINVVGGYCFNNVKIGLLLYLSHILSSLFIGVIFSRYKKDNKSNNFNFTIKQTDNVISEAITSSINSALFVGGFITLFYLFTEILYNIGILNLPIGFLTLIFKDSELAKATIFGLFESTKGFKFLSMLPKNRLSYCVSSFLLGFSGLSIIMQSTSSLKRAKIKTAPFLFSKVLSAVLNLIFSLIFSLLLF